MLISTLPTTQLCSSTFRPTESSGCCVILQHIYNTWRFPIHGGTPIFHPF